MPAVGHRVARVDGEVHEHLLELSRVGKHGIAGIDASVATSSTSSPISAREHRRQAGDDVVQLEHARVQYLASAERE